MASIQSRALLNLPTSDTMTRQKIETSRIAQEQQAAISEKLRRNGLPMPEFTFLELIGKGSYGRVFKAKDIENDRVVALKVIDVDSQDYKVNAALKDNGIHETLHEIRVLQQLKDSKAKNINQFFEAFQIHSQLWIVNDYCPGGSVRTLMRGTNDKLDEKYILPIARELAIGLKAIHDAGIIHRDIKAANIMIHEKGMVQIIDFGIAGVLQTSIDKRSTVVGTPHWMAPEMWKNAPPEGLSYGTEIDVWAYGCTLYEIAMGTPPAHRTQPGRMLGIALTREPPRLRQSDFSEGLCNLVAFVLSSNPANRPSMDSILQDSYIHDTEESHPTTSLVDLVKKFYQWERSGGQRQSLFIQVGAPAAEFPEDLHEIEDEWNFSTTANFEQQFSTPARSPNPTLSSGLVDDNIYGPSSTQAVEDSFNSYLVDSQIYTPLTSPGFTSFMAEPERDDQPEYDTMGQVQREPVRDDHPGYNGVGQTQSKEVRIERGGKYLQGLFNESESPYVYGAKDSPGAQGPPIRPTAGRVKSDLPLRDENESSSLMRKEVDVVDIQRSKGTVPNIDLANVGTIKANRLNRNTGTGSQDEDSDDNNYGGFNEPKRSTMGWTFPQPATSEVPNEPKRDTMAWSFPNNEAAEDSDNDATPMFREPKRDTTAFVFPQMAIPGEASPKTSPTTLPVRPALKHAITAPAGDFSRSESGVLDLDAMLEDAKPADRSLFRTALSSDDEGSTRPASTDSDEDDIGTTVDNAKASEATARRLGRLSAYQAQYETDSDDDEKHLRPTVDTSGKPTFPFMEKARGNMTREELQSDNLKRNAYIDAMGFPEIKPPSGEAMAMDAPPDVVAAELTRLLLGHGQGLQTMRNILIHRRELGYDGGVRENPMLMELMQQLGSLPNENEEHDEEGEYEEEEEDELEMGNGNGVMRKGKSNGSKSG